MFVFAIFILFKEMTKEEIITKCNEAFKNTLVDFLEITFTDVTDNQLIAKMPITQKVIQPNGILHGGASAALAESVGSMASVVFAVKDREKEAVLGIDISMNHIKAVQNGVVYATATQIHLGRTLQHWDIKITDEQGNLISYGKHTTIIVPKK